MKFSQRIQQETESDRRRFLEIGLFRDLLMNAPFELDTYIYFLVSAYQHVRWTTPLYGLVLSRMVDAPIKQRRAVVHYIQDELGHELWIANDLQALGIELSAMELPEAARVFVDFLKDVAARRAPLTLLGMSYVLENHSVSFGPLTIALLKKQHGLPDEALTYLQSHSDLDVDHLKLQQELLDSITDRALQEDIIQCAKETFDLYGDLFRSLQQARVSAKQ
jgi:pyrroloquinoline quinone (PQQ) biosynthesis protein C